MSGYPWAALTPRLRESIEMQPRQTDGFPGPVNDDRTCGCHERAGKWWLCQYHDGFQDAEAIMLTEVERLTAERDEARRLAERCRDVAYGWPLGGNGFFPWEPVAERGQG